MALVALLSLGVVPSAQGAFPGQNGRIAFSTLSPGAIYSVNSDLGGQTQLTGLGNHSPAWSPDGQRIAFVSLREGAPEIWVMNADGSDQTRLTNNTFNDADPSWSPDGAKILFANDYYGTYDVWSMNPDGSGQALVGGSETEHDTTPVQSPTDGRIAFTRGHGFATDHVWLMDSAGTDDHLLTQGRRPDWSPDGARLVFSRDIYQCEPDPLGDFMRMPQVYRINADGSGEVQMTRCGFRPGSHWLEHHEPVWSPDGARVAWRMWSHVGGTDSYYHSEIHVMDADETNGGPPGQEPVASDLLKEFPDWQPLQPGYPRPKGATPSRAPLVPAYIVCAAPNRTHGPPLAFPSCSPPQRRSGVLTVGTPDANGAAAGMVGSATITALTGNPTTPGDQADIAVNVSITDVRCGAASAACPSGSGSDYAGWLLLAPSTLRITDRLNIPPGPDGVPGTGDGQLQIPIDCVPTSDPGVGSTCALSTTVDTLLPGAVREGKRSIWELGQIHVRDAGPNGTGYESPACPPDCGDGDETLFLRQGVFVP